MDEIWDDEELIEEENEYTRDTWQAPDVLIGMIACWEWIED